MDHFWKAFFRATTATTSHRIQFLDFLQPSVTTFDTAMPSELMGAEYLLQIVNLHPLQEILWADLVLGGDTAHPANHRPVIVPQVMHIRWGRGPCFDCMEHGIPDTWIINISSGENEQEVRMGRSSLNLLITNCGQYESSLLFSQ